MMKRALSFAACSLILTGCLGFGSSSENNVQMSATAGNCPAGAINAPYCMAITIQNNPNGQNYINSTNYPISSIAITTSGSTSVISPMLNAGSMDPNGCTSTTLQPGGSCTFYVAITSENYPVGSYNPINVTANYTVNDSLFVNGDHTASSSMTIYQRTNLYILNNLANLWTWSNNGLSNVGLVESTNMSGQTLLSSSLGYATGKLILSNANSIWSYGNGSVSSSANSGALNGSNLLFTLSNGIYASAYSTGNFWTGTESSSSLTWTNTGLPSVPVNANAYAISPSSNLYVAVGGQALNCAGITNSSATKACNNEAVGLSGAINAFGYAGILYAGSSNGTGIYYESGTGTTATWVPVTQVPATTLGSINVMKTASNGNYVIAADSINNIWSISSGATSATQVTTAPGSVTALAIDNLASSPNIYYVANNQLYSCGSGGIASCTTPTVIASGLSGTMLNLIVGSSLSTN